MRFFGRFETKLVLTYLVIIVAVVGVVGFFIVRPLEDLARDQIAKGLEAQARLMAREVVPETSGAA